MDINNTIQNTKFENSLKYLSAFYYAIAVFNFVVALSGFVYIYAAIDFVKNPEKYNLQGSNDQIAAKLILAYGVFVVVLFLAYTVLSFLAARYLNKKIKFTFCIITAGLLLIDFPCGTILGVFTLIYLTKPHVRVLFK